MVGPGPMASETSHLVVESEWGKTRAMSSFPGTRVVRIMLKKQNKTYLNYIPMDEIWALSSSAFEVKF